MKLLSHIIVLANESQAVGYRPLGRAPSYCRGLVNTKCRRAMGQKLMLPKPYCNAAFQTDVLLQ